MAHSSTVSFLSYWRGLQDSPDKAPSRERFDPVRLKSLIPQLMMISCSDPGYRFRLSGGFLVAFHGFELKSTSFTSLFRAPFVKPVETALVMAQRRHQPLILKLSAPWLSRGAACAGEDVLLSRSETVSFEICLCPMLNQKGEVDRFVGIYQTLSPMPADPYGAIGRYTLDSARIFEHHRLVRAAHLRLVAVEGRPVA
ncbi:MAG: PAS domain-containing protein [Asticcacaulis sp.]